MTSEPTLEQLIADTLFLMKIHDLTEVVDSHLVWIGPVDSSDAPVVRRPGHGRKFFSVRRVVLELNGRNMKSLLATSHCDCPLCIKHLQGITRKNLQMRTARTTNWQKSPARCAAISAERRKTAVLSMDKVKAMREAYSMGKITTYEAGRLYGVSQSVAADAIAGRTWRDYTNPFMGLMA